MSAILSADDLNDFISPGVACIKPVETLPAQQPPEYAYEVTTEDKVAADAPPAQISLTDCLACSGCVTSAEAVLVSLQSHAEVLNALDATPSLGYGILRKSYENGTIARHHQERNGSLQKPRLFVASVSPQVRASLAATYAIKEREAGWLIDQLLGGPDGLATGGKYGNSFSFIVDTNAMRDVALVVGAEEVSNTPMANTPANVKKPILTSACPGWVCYAEKTHPHVLPHLSRVKSPQALTGTLFKTILSQKLGIDPDQIWHLAIMPCFDKKLEASRAELTNVSWQSDLEVDGIQSPTRDVDCVITAREILMLADSRGISFPSLPKKPLNADLSQMFPDNLIADFLFSPNDLRRKRETQIPAAGTSGGFLYHTLCTQQQLHPGSEIRSQRGRNADVVEYTVAKGEEAVFRAARYYGFRNIQNLVRKLKPTKEIRLAKKVLGARQPAERMANSDYAYVEVMACPGGCTNGGGQIKIDDLGSLQGRVTGSESQKEWLTFVDEAYYSMEESDNRNIDCDEPSSSEDSVNGISTPQIKEFLKHWEAISGIDRERLIYTSFREVHSDVGKPKKGDSQRVAEVAASIGGGW